MAELADALGSEPGARCGREGSSPSIHTKEIFSWLRILSQAINAHPRCVDLWRRVRVAYGACFENRCGEIHRRFKSCRLRRAGVVELADTLGLGPSA